MKIATASTLLLLACEMGSGTSSAPSQSEVATALAASPASAGAPAPKAASSTLPAKTSGFDGWRGVKVQRGLRCQNCCDLVFPPRFGATPEELALLQQIVATYVEDDLQGCMMPRVEDTLDHLRRLAVEHQDRGAAEVLLRAKSPGGLDIPNAEAAQSYGATWLVPTLLGYRGLTELLTPELERHVAVQVCGAAFDPTGEDVDPGAIAAQLKARGATSLATRIVQTCKGMEQELE